MIRQVIEISVQKRKWDVRNMQKMVVIPVTGFPRVDGMANEEERA